jgi:DNA polymerase-3 subunit epsilon
VTQFAVLDVETTGLSPDRGDRVVEIAIIVLDENFRVVRMLDSLVHPCRRIPQHVASIHGISDLAVQEAPTFTQLIPELLDCFSGVTHLVAHNISFDLSFLRSEFSVSGLQIPRILQKICTMQLARRYRVAHNAKLATVARALRIPTIANAHRAVIDAGVTARVLSLLHTPEPDNSTTAISWPRLDAELVRVPQYPRPMQQVSLQSLTKFGLQLKRKDEKTLF